MILSAIWHALRRRMPPLPYGRIVPVGGERHIGA